MLADTECGNEAIDRLPHRVTTPSQRAVVSRGLLRQSDAPRLKHFQSEQLALNVLCRSLALNALQDFAQDQIGDAQALAIELRVKPIGLWIRGPPEVVNPDRGVNDNHRRLLWHAS